jgi:hypothetical protein
MEAALVWEAQTGPGVPARDGRSLGPGDAREPDLPGSVEFLVEQRDFSPGAEEQVAVQALEVAVDALLARDLLDAVNGGGLGLVDLPRLVETPQLDQLVVPVVEFGGEVGGGTRRHAPADRATIKHHDGAAGAGELAGDREAGDASPDHDDIGGRVA